MNKKFDPVKKAMKILGADYIPYDFIKGPFTERQHKIFDLTSEARKLNIRTENYLRRYLRKRRNLYKKIRDVPMSVEFECEVCNKIFKRRLEVHTQANNSDKGFRYICCRCLGHDPLSCLENKGRISSGGVEI